MHRIVLQIACAACLVMAAGGAAFGQSSLEADSPTSAPAAVKPPLKAAYLRVGLEVPLPTAVLDGLPAFLKNESALQEAMALAGREGVLIYQIDSFQEMLDRLEHREFDLAYCPAKILVEQQAGYVPILQLRPRKVIVDSSTSRMIAWRGVIIGSRSAPPFNQGDTVLTDEALAAYFRNNGMAFPSAHSAVGYIYPQLTLRRRFGVEQPGNYIFLGSSREVARAVINGLIPVGACEEGALLEVVESIPPVDGKPWEVDQVVRILARTPIVPTDPIIVRVELAPERSALGLALRDAMRRFHEQRNELPRVGESTLDNFNQLREDMLLLRLNDDLRQFQP